jgi:hypothetical protein
MNQPHLPSDDSLESDAVWNLLDQAARVRPRPSFADDVVRLAKLEPAQQAWWKKFMAPAPKLGLAVAAVTAIVAVNFLFRPDATAPRASEPTVSAPAQLDPFADLQDFAETETLIAAADHLDDFSDQELAGLIGF